MDLIHYDLLYATATHAKVILLVSIRNKLHHLEP